MYFLSGAAECSERCLRRDALAQDQVDLEAFTTWSFALEKQRLYVASSTPDF